MHIKVYKEYEKICQRFRTHGRVLEVGAIPNRKSLLAMDCLDDAIEKIGINLDGPHEYRDFKIVKGNGNSMTMFQDNYFDIVLCNATLEHDKFFWKTIHEIHRVLSIGGRAIIGVPGYVFYNVEWIKRICVRIPIFNILSRNSFLNGFFRSTVTFEIHDAPGDYYRFSRQTVMEVFFHGYVDVEVRSVMVPPRIIGTGIKSKENVHV